jgi:hypothetical protein
MYRHTALTLIGLATACLSLTVPMSSAIADSYDDSHGDRSDHRAAVVGMWHVVLQLGDESGPVYDEVLEHFHSDGTELLISNGIPPALGNICIGVWRQVSHRTYTLKHMTWNWSPDFNADFGVPGTFAGHFELHMRFRVDERGKTYSGTWVAQNFDESGNHIPELDAEGVVKGMRISPD